MSSTSTRKRLVGDSSRFPALIATRWGRFPAVLAASLAAAWLFSVAGAGNAAEEARRFLDALRQREYHDIALDYLETLQNDPNCPADMKDILSYEEGITRIAGCGGLGSSQLQQQLDGARDAFNKFLADHPEHQSAAAAGTQLANVLVVRGRHKMKQAERPGKTEEVKKSLTAEARSFYQEAKTALEAADARLYQKAKALRDSADQDVDVLEEAYKDLVLAKSSLGQVEYEIGKTYEPGSEPFKKHLTDAANRFNKLYETYGKYYASWYARLAEARARGSLGENVEAITILHELIPQIADKPTLLPLKSDCLILLLEICLKPDVQKYQDSIAMFEAWRKASTPRDRSTATGLKLHLLGGSVLLKHAKSLEAQDAARRENIVAAKRHLEFVARFTGENRRQANEILADEVFGDQKAEAGTEPVDFAEARDRGDFAWGTVVLTHEQIQQAKDESQRAELADELARVTNEAAKYYSMAIQMRTEETTVAETNAIRFRLANLFFLADDYFRAAVLGEFLARRYPTDIHARRGADVAIKSYRTLFLEGLEASQDTAFEIDKMTALAEFASGRWKDEPETDEAWLAVVHTTVANRQLDRAVEYMANIAPDSPQRAAAELSLGTAFWGAYTRAVTEEENRPPREELDRWVGQSKEMLEKGIGRLRAEVEKGGSVEYPLVKSVRSLAHILTDTGQPEEAVKWLEDAKIGPLTLVASASPVTDLESFQVDTYITALRAYVGAEELEKAEKTIDALEALVGQGDDADTGARLTRIYYSLGRDLEALLGRLRSEGKSDQLKSVTKSFEKFLERISSRKQGANYKSLNWVAETFFSLGAGIDPGVGEIDDDAKEYYRRAADTYKEILELPKDEKPAGADISVKFRRAACLRAMGSYKEAMKIFVRILVSRETWVDVQVEAARTYQARAGEKGQAGYYKKAIGGGYEHKGRRLVWGWAGIAYRVAASKEHRAVFHDAIYSMATCRMKLALSLSGQEKADMLVQAEKDVTRTYKQYPKMGGPEQFTKYDSLLKTIRKFRGMRDPKGLKD